MKKIKVLKIIKYLVIVILSLISLVWLLKIRFSNIDMTELRLLVTYWKQLLVILVMLISALALYTE